LFLKPAGALYQVTLWVDHSRRPGEIGRCITYFLKCPFWRLAVTNGPALADRSFLIKGRVSAYVREGRNSWAAAHRKLFPEILSRLSSAGRIVCRLFERDALADRKMKPKHQQT
jgi:hypothetical protein